MPTADSVHQACRTYLNAVRAIRATSQHTREQSFYTPLNNLLDALVVGSKPARRVMGYPAGIDGDFPDVALYEVAANVLVLPFEVKPPTADVVALAARTVGRGEHPVQLPRSWRRMSTQQGEQHEVVSGFAAARGISAQES